MPKVTDTPGSNGRHTGNGRVKQVSPSPGKEGKKATPTGGRAGQGSQVRRAAEGHTGVAVRVADFVGRFVVLPRRDRLIIACWVMAAWLADVWDRFGHLAVTSPEKRCGKSRLLELLALLAPRAYMTSNISPAAVYRLVQAERATLIVDEAQSVSRNGSESSEVLRELLNASISRDASVIRCGGPNRDTVERFSVYGPKIVANILPLDPVLADRCLPVEMVRKTAADAVEPFRSRVAGPAAEELRSELEKWAEENRGRVAEVYDKTEPFAISNDRLAELLTPLQAVAAVDDPHGAADIDGSGGVPEGTRGLTAVLRSYAQALEERERREELMSPGVRLLAACRELFTPGVVFMPTATLLAGLVARKEEPWGRWCKGSPMTHEALATLLRPYNVRPSRNRQQTARGYHRADFEGPWESYLLPPAPPSPPARVPAKKSSNPSTLSRSRKES